jgi:hypothetical protein
MTKIRYFIFMTLLTSLSLSFALAAGPLPDGLDHERAEFLMGELRKSSKPFVQEVVNYYDNYQTLHTREMSSLIQKLQEVDRSQEIRDQALRSLTADLKVVDAVRGRLAELKDWPEGMTHPFKANKHQELLRLAHHFYTVEWDSWRKGESASWGFNPNEIPILGAQDSIRGNAKESALAMAATYGLLADWSLHEESPRVPNLLDLKLGFSPEESTTFSILGIPSAFEDMHQTSLYLPGYLPGRHVCFTTTSGYSFGGGRPTSILNYIDGTSAPDCSSLIGWALGKRGQDLFDFNTGILNTVPELTPVSLGDVSDFSQLNLGDLYAPKGHVAVVVEYNNTDQTVTVFESNRNMADMVWDDALQTYMPNPREALTEYEHRRNLEGIGFRIHPISKLAAGAPFYRVK